MTLMMFLDWWSQHQFKGWFLVIFGGVVLIQCCEGLGKIGTRREDE